MSRTSEAEVLFKKLRFLYPEGEKWAFEFVRAYGKSDSYELMVVMLELWAKENSK